MGSFFKTDTSNKNQKIFKSLSLLSASCILLTTVGCASKSTAPVVEIEEAAPAQQEVAESAASEKEREQNADELMAKLKAPVLEPKASQSKELQAQTKSLPEQKNTETKTAQSVTKEKALEEVKTVAAKVDASVKQSAEPIAQSSTSVVAQEKELVASAEKAVEEVKKTVEKTINSGPAKPLSISKKDLPASYDIWVLKEGETALTKGLVISTPTWEMGKIGYNSQIWLTFKEDEIHVNSSSDIATEVKGLGISIDGGKLIPFTRIAENNIGIVEGQWLDKLANGNKLDIYLGFFPGKKPTSERFKSDTSLENLDRVVATYRKLNN